MALFLYRGKAIFFAHVPKAAGTSVEDYLLRRLGRAGFVDSHKRTGVRGSGLIPPASHLSAQDLEELLPPRLDFNFALVRDPLSRIQSEFRYQTGVSASSKFSFSTWLRIMAACLAKDRRVYENHIRPQSEMVPHEAEIFRLEDGGIARMIERLDEVLAETAEGIDLQHMNRRPERPLSLTKEDVALVETMYAADYGRFGYDRPDYSGLPSDRLSGARHTFANGVAAMIVARQRRRWVAPGPLKGL